MTKAKSRVEDAPARANPTAEDEEDGEERPPRPSVGKRNRAEIEELKLYNSVLSAQVSDIGHSLTEVLDILKTGERPIKRTALPVTEVKEVATGTTPQAPASVAVAPGVVPLSENHSCPKFPRREIFDEIFELPLALSEYRTWATQNQVSMKALAMLPLYLPKSLRTYFNLTQTQATRARMMESWDTAEEVIIETAGKVIGARVIRKRLDDLRVEPSDRVVDKMGELVLLCRFNSPRNRTDAEKEAMSFLVRKLPPSVTARVGYDRDQSMNMPELIAAFQKEFDANILQGSSSSPTVAAMLRNSVVRITCCGESVKLKLDSGADVCVVSASSTLGKKLGTQQKENAFPQSVVSPLDGRSHRVVWAVPTTLQAAYTDDKGIRHEKNLPLVLHGVEGMRDEVVYVGKPTTREWGVITDDGTMRIGVRSLRESENDPIPWFSEKDFLGSETHTPAPSHAGQVQRETQHRRWQRQPQGVRPQQGNRQWKTKGSQQQEQLQQQQQQLSNSRNPRRAVHQRGQDKKKKF